MPIYRVTYPVGGRAWPRQYLISDVEADRISTSSTQVTLWKVVPVIGKPRWVVALRGSRSQLRHIERRCRTPPAS